MRKIKTLSERFWSKVDVSSPEVCWCWKAKKNNKGYGMLRLGGKLGFKLAHRVSFELNIGEIPSGQIIMHKCDNPTCVNPNHLRIGTMKNNYDDMVSKGRRKLGRNPLCNPPVFYGENHPKAKFTNNEAIEIKQFLAAGVSARFLARSLEVDKSVIFKIKHGKTYAEAII